MSIQGALTKQKYLLQLNLLQKISSIDSIRNAWLKLNKSNQESHGVTGETIASLKNNIDSILESISKKLQENRYRLSPTRAVLIPKEGGLRPLRVPEVRDRIVLKSLAIELETILNDELEKGNGVSFAYQKKLGIRDALQTLEKYYNDGFNFILKCDIVKFFDRIDREILLNEKLFKHLPDDSVNQLIHSAINQEVGNMNEIKPHLQKHFHNTELGIPQGNPLSPLFSNLYLSDFDLFMKSNNYRLIRYADDFIVALNFEEDALNCFRDIENYLSKHLSLELHPLKESGKSKIIDLNKESITFLGIEYDGKEMLPSRESIDRLKGKVLDIIHLKKDSNTVLELLQDLKYTLEGWVAAYSFCKVEKFAREIDQHIDRLILKPLNRFGWKLTSNSKGKLDRKLRKKNSSYDRLSDRQRIYSGIPTTNQILDRLRDNE